jgi:protein jag
MEKIVLKAKNREELDSMVKRTLTLGEDEEFRIKVLKEPKKILFFNINGEYEIDIVKKGEKREVSRVKPVENRTGPGKNDGKYENKKNEVRNSGNGHRENRKNDGKNTKENIKSGRKNWNGQNTENKEKNPGNDHLNSENVKIQKEENRKAETEAENSNDPNFDRIRSFMKEFIVNSKLSLKIVNISKEGERYVINVDGKDIRYLIGEKGSSLNAIEYLLTSVKTLKNIKVVIDSNNYKDKREEALRELARKKGKKVLDSGRNVKLNPMSARERKIIHEEISFIKGLKTESVGEEPKRYLVIKRIKD